MKKILSLLLTIGLCFSLVACNAGNNGQETKATTIEIVTDKDGEQETKEPAAQTDKKAKNETASQVSSDSESDEETEDAIISDESLLVSRDGVNYFEKYEIVNKEHSVTFTDSVGNIVTIPKNPERVAMLYNSYLDLWKTMGGEIIAHCTLTEDKEIPGLEGAEDIGSASNLNMEKVIELEPDFCVIGNFSANIELSTQLNELGIPTIYFETKSRDDYYKLVRLFSAILDDESVFEKYALDIEDGIQEIIAKVPEGERPRALIMIATTKSVKVRNSDNINGEMIADLGASNIADNDVTGDRAAEYSLEEIVKEDPDIIFVTEMGSDREAIEKNRKEFMEEDPVWGGLTAMKEGHYHVLPKDLYTYKPNQHYVEAYRILAEYLYPDVDFSLEEKLNDSADNDVLVSRDGVNYYDKYDLVNDGNFISLTDSLGTKLKIVKHPQRVVNLYNSYLSIWKLMGGEVIGIADQAAAKPIEGIEDAEVLGSPSKPNMEKIVELEPDFCVMGTFSSNAELAEQLNDLGVPTLYLESKNKDEYYKVVRLFSGLLEDEAMFEKYALDIEQEIQEIIAKVPQDAKPKILVMIASPSTVRVRSSDTTTGGMLKDLGAINIADEVVEGDNGENYSLEKIVEEDPDIIFVCETGSDVEAVAETRKKLIEDDPVWSGLTAVKEGRYHVLSKDLFTYMPNERFAEAYRILAGYLYPDLDLAGDK